MRFTLRCLLCGFRRSLSCGRKSECVGKRSHSVRACPLFSNHCLMICYDIREEGVYEGHSPPEVNLARKISGKISPLRIPYLCTSFLMLLLHSTHQYQSIASLYFCSAACCNNYLLDGKCIISGGTIADIIDCVLRHYDII